MFKLGDIIEMNSDVPYMVTRPGTKWMVYSFLSGDRLRIGTPPIEGRSTEQMIVLYGNESLSRHAERRFKDGIKLFTILTNECHPSGNNAVFKKHLLQGDMWEEEKSRPTLTFTKSRSGNMTSSFLLNEDDDWLPI